MTGPIKVAVIDDHPLFREGVANTIQRSGAVQVIAEGETADDAIEIAKAKLPDIVLLDVSLPGGGMEAARAIVKACPVVKIVMLTVSESEEHVQQAMAAGVHGYVLKGTSGPELINTLRAVARGEYYVTPTFAARILAHARRPPKAPPRDDGNGDLTKREEQILDRVARRPDQQGDRRRAANQREDREALHDEHPAEAAGPQPGRGGDGIPQADAGDVIAARRPQASAPPSRARVAAAQAAKRPSAIAARMAAISSW